MRRLELFHLADIVAVFPTMGLVRPGGDERRREDLGAMLQRADGFDLDGEAVTPAPAAACDNLGQSLLTPRQEECLRLSANMTDKEMARALGISPKTVSLHISEAMRRLEVGSRRAARLKLGENPLWASPPMAVETGSVPIGRVGAGTNLDQPPGFYRPPPQGGVITSAIIGAFAVFGAVLILIFLLQFGYRLL